MTQYKFYFLKTNANNLDVVTYSHIYCNDYQKLQFLYRYKICYLKKHSWTYTEISKITMYIDNYNIIHLINILFLFRYYAKLSSTINLFNHVEYEMNKKESQIECQFYIAKLLININSSLI